MKKRDGATLVEVMVAIFVMGIGLLALLTLFPVGILTMLQAIQDDKTAVNAANAKSIAIARKIRWDKELLFQVAGKDVFTNPNPNPQPLEKNLTDAPANAPSYAVYVDPIGVRSYQVPPLDKWIAGQSEGIARRDVDFIKSIPLGIVRDKRTWQWFSSLDDIMFGFEGIPAPIRPGTFERESNWSWAYLLRRPATSLPSVVDLTVVVYDDRPTALKTLAQSGETTYTATFNPIEKIVNVQWVVGQTPPNISLGDWILDTTPVLVQPNQYGPSHAKFYRVVGLTQRSPTSADLEVQQPIQGFPSPSVRPPPYPGTIVVMDGIADVYEMGTGIYPQ